MRALLMYSNIIMIMSAFIFLLSDDIFLFYMIKVDLVHF